MNLPSYSQYISLDNDARERLYQQYCKKNKLDPLLEYSVFEFFDTIDKKEEVENETNHS